MGLLPEEVIAQVRDRADIASWIGERVPLKRAGRNLKGLCPFHAEKTPSFMVSPEKQIYHCFGCGAGGSIFHFLMKADGLSFPEAIRRVASRYGIDLPEPRADSRRPDEVKILLKLNAFAARFYQQELKVLAANHPARTTLEQRGVSVESIQSFGLGWADPTGNCLAKALQAAKAPLDKAMEVGLLRTNPSGQFEDFFRGRLIFPIHDARGRVVGFGGRTLSKEASVPKYLNSPDTPVFHKGTLLYGLWQGREAIRKEGEMILVEGYLDVIALHQMGLKTAAAPLGTSLTETHIKVGSRLVQRWTTFFDGDEAGERATRRALELFLAHNIISRTLPCPEGHDPDSLAHQPQGRETISRLKEKAPLTLTWVVQQALRKGGGRLEGRLAILREATGWLRTLSDPLVLNLLVREVSEATGIEERHLHHPPSTTDSGGATSLEKRPRLQGYARRLMELVLIEPQLWQKAAPALRHIALGDPIFEGLMETLHRFTERWGHLDVGRLMDETEDSTLRALVTEIVMTTPTCPQDKGDEALAEIVDRLVTMGKKYEMEQLTKKIREAEGRHDEDSVALLMAAKQRLIGNATAERAAIKEG